MLIGSFNRATRYFCNAVNPLKHKCIFKLHKEYVYYTRGEVEDKVYCSEGCHVAPALSSDKGIGCG